jgi:hypothetical protein
MSTLVVDMVFPAAPITTLLKRIEKGLEHFYYAGLFAQNSAYDGTAIWRDWSEMGFHVAIVSAPPGTAAEDKIRVSVRAPSNSPVLTVEGTNTAGLKYLQSLLETIDSLRPSLAGQSPEAKAEALRSGPLADQLGQPVLDALHRNHLTDTEIDHYQKMLSRGLDALTNEHIKTINLKIT